MGDDDEVEILWGASAIARFIGRSRRQTYHLLEGGHLPAKKLGNSWAAAKSVLREHFAAQPPATSP